MITVVKEGALPVEQIFSGACKNCGTVIKAGIEDHAADWTPAKKGRIVIEVNCPLENCGHLIRCRKTDPAKI